MGDTGPKTKGPRPVPTALALDYRLDERITLGTDPPYRHVERWQVAVVADSASEGGPPAEIGYAQVLVFNLEPGDDIGDYADRDSGTWVDHASRVGRPRSARGPRVDVGAHDSHVLLLDRVWLHPDWRGHGLGPILAAAVIERLGRGCHLAACYPAPFDHPTQLPDARDRAIEALGRLWSKVGFTHWRDGVWTIDLNSRDRHAALAQLVASGTTCSARWTSPGT